MMTILERVEADAKLPPEPKRHWQTVRTRQDRRCVDCGKHYENTKREFCRCDGYLQEVAK